MRRRALPGAGQGGRGSVGSTESSTRRALAAAASSPSRRRPGRSRHGPQGAGHTRARRGAGTRAARLPGPVLVVHVSARWRGPGGLHRGQRLPRHVRACADPRWTADHGHQLGDLARGRHGGRHAGGGPPARSEGDQSPPWGADQRGADGVRPRARQPAAAGRRLSQDLPRLADYYVDLLRAGTGATAAPSDDVGLPESASASTARSPACRQRLCLTDDRPRVADRRHLAHPAGHRRDRRRRQLLRPGRSLAAGNAAAGPHPAALRGCSCRCEQCSSTRRSRRWPRTSRRCAPQRAWRSSKASARRSRSRARPRREPAPARSARGRPPPPRTTG